MNKETINSVLIVIITLLSYLNAKSIYRYFYSETFSDTELHKKCSDESINDTIYNYNVNEINLQNLRP